MQKKKSIKNNVFSKEQINKIVKLGDFRVVLNGQQRITSIYRVLKRIGNVWFVVKNNNEFEEDIDFNNMTLEEILFGFSGKQDESRLCINVGDAFEMIENQIREKLVQDKYFKDLEFAKKSDDRKIDCYFGKLLHIIGKLQDFFKA